MSEVRLPAPVAAVVIAKDDFHDREQLAPGTVAFNGEPPAGVWYVCPCGCGSRSMLPIRDADNDHPSWVWDGNRAAPTLSPSIHHVGHWHGYLRAGMWVQA